jgi:CheY-like chemotaxis protein
MVPGKRGSLPKGAASKGAAHRDAGAREKEQGKVAKHEAHRPTVPTPHARPAKLQKIPLEPKRILITDDEEYLRELLSSQLEEKGYTCVSLASKADAYRWSLKNKPDLIITDINSPGMDGFQFLRLIKSHSSTGKVPVVFLTGVASSETEEQAKRMGAAEFVTKPCSLADVQTVVERVLTAHPHGRVR